MVKNIFGILLSILWICVAVSCNVDMGGLFGSTDLDERIKEKNNFKFLNSDALSPAWGDEYSFIVITDIYAEDRNAYGLEKIQDVTKNNQKIKFAVLCGDLTQTGSEQEIKKILDIVRSTGIPVYPVIGNHDIFFGNWSVIEDFTTYKTYCLVSVKGTCVSYEFKKL